MTHAHRIIKHPDPKPVQVKELSAEESAFYLGRDFGMSEFADTQPSEPLEWALEETKPSRLGRTKRSWK